VVIVQCPGCQNRHLIADNLGFFDDQDGGWNIEKGMGKLGEDVKVVTNEDVLELSVEDVWGHLAAKATTAGHTTITTTTKSGEGADNGNTKQ
jgi:protein import protein ZIM17